MANYYLDDDGKLITDPKKKKGKHYIMQPDGTFMLEEEEEIAPVKKDEGKLDFFQKGAFDDGYQMWDVTKSILGTVGDAGVGVVKGGAGLVEGVMDLGAYAEAGIADLFGADEYAENLRKEAQKNSVQESFKGVDNWLDQYSVLGSTSDSITQGLGQVGTLILTGGIGAAGGLGTAGVTALTTGTMGVSSMGSGMSDAYNYGATDGEALAYGVSKGAIDAGTELLFGGLGKAVGAVGLSKGISSLDDVFAQRLSSGISNQVAKNFIEFGVKASGEGFEEVLAGLGTSVAKKLTYMDEEELTAIIEDENLLEQFIVGTVTSGMIQSGYIPGTANGSLKDANAKGSDFITGYTQNEQSVINKLVDNEVEKQEADGKKLTNKEIGEIEKQVKNSLERGEIDIDTIESVLGGETYSEYDTLLKESKEYEELYNTKNSDLSKKQEDRLAELTEKNKKSPYEVELSNLRERLSQEVRTKTENDTFLLESYNEKAKKSRTFEADLNKYDEKQQETVKKAIDSGILNDTKKTHEFVDMLAKLSAEKGVSFDFMNNEKLKKSGFAIEGKTINGFVKDGNIALNINSNKALNTVVGHEITHVLEGTALYSELQTAITEYAKSKGDYDSRFEAISKLYEGVENANIENELTADLVGDYLFTDSNFINNLSTTKPNVFKRIYNEIKYLLKLATAGSNEARQLEKVKKAFDKAYKESKSNSTTSSEVEVAENADVQYSVSNDSEGRTISPAVQKRFANSKAVDENGSLKVLYHGTPSGEFTIFDKSKGSIEGDFGSGFYFTDNESDVETNYEGGGPDFENKVARRAEQIEADEDIDYDEAEQRAREELYKGSNKFEVYLNIENPAIVGETILLDQESLDPGYDIDDFDSEEEYYEQIEQDIAETIEEVVWEVEKNVDLYSTDGISDVLFEAYYEGGISIEDLKARINELYLEDNEGNLAGNEVTRQIIESLGYDGIIDSTVSSKFSNMGLEEGTTHYIVFKPNQIKSVTNENPTDNPDINLSLSGKNDVTPVGKYNVYGKDIALETVSETENVAPVVQEKTDLVQEVVQDVDEYAHMTEEQANERDAMQSDRLNTLTESDMPEEIAPYYDEELSDIETESPFDDKDIQEVGNRKQKAYMYENPEVKPYFQEEAHVMLGELRNSIKGEKHFNDQLYYDTNGEQGWYGTKRETSEQIAYMLDRFKYTYADIEKGLKAIVEDHGAENNAISKRLEFMIDERLREGYTDFVSGVEIPSNQDYINLLRDKQINTYSDEAYNQYLESLAYAEPTEMVEDIAPMPETDAVEVLYSLEEQQQEKVAEIDSVVNEEETTENTPLPNGKKDYDARMANYKNAIEGYNTAKDTIVSAYDETINKKTAEYNSLKRKDTKKASNLLSQIETLKLRKSENITTLNSKIARVERIIDNMVNNETEIRDNEKWERKKQRINDRFEQNKQQLREEYDEKKTAAMEELKDRNSFVSQKAYDLYNELKNLKKGVRASEELGYFLDFGYPWSELKTALLNTRAKPHRMVNRNSAIESVVREAIGRDYEARLDDTSYSIEEEYQNELKELERERDLELGALEESRTKIKRTDYHRNIVDKIKNAFSSKGYDFDKVLETAKNKGTFSSVDNTPQRFIEKSLGYKEGQILNDLTINKVAQNETQGIAWLNSFTDKKSGLLAKISKEYGIKPRSKESAAAQMYAEGFWVDDDGNFIKYGDAELAQDYPDARIRANIKKLAKDERIRKIYDETLEMINESRKRNLYPEIPRRNNYFLHFREMDDTFSRLGIPFNPNDIKLKDLPTDINGMTADLKPGQPYFASAKQRMGYKTTYDLVGGVERYLNSAKNQIYHIDDIQTLRALRNYIADTFGQAKGLESLDSMTEEEAVARIEEVYNSHLSTFAKFLNEEANILAGKTSLTDRGLEGVIGRRGIQFLDTVNRQVGSNMVGANVSSALTNTVSTVQAFAKSNKFDATKAFAQTVSNKIGSLFGKSDGFAESNPMMIRRKGIERLTKTPWESITDKGYLLMSAIDGVSSEFIARTKFNELIRKGMSEQQAHIEADKWASRILGDRSLGQQPQLYNSKMLGLITKFQLEVRNQLDSQFYDTIQEAKVSNEEVENRLLRNAKTSAKVASTFFQLAVLQHLFGKAFESLAGYNPAFDIVEVLMQVFGLDDDEESEDTVLDNLEEGFLTLLGDLPYTSTLTGGRVPIASALPIEQFITGKDDYGNEKSRWETIKETAPYYLLPTGYGQIKKTTQGLAMFDDELPIAGSYTDSGNLRYSIEDTPANRLKSAIFGQYSSETARDYFDNERAPLKEKQIEELVELDIPIKDYWKYREGLKEQDTLEEKFDYIAGLDYPVEKKNIMINNIVDRKEEVDLTNYDDFANYDEFDFSVKNPEKYEYLRSINVSYAEYSSNEETKDAYDWAYQNPEKYVVSKAIGDIVTYRQYSKDINKFEADKDENGKSISGSKKEKVINYISSLDIDYGQKIILYRSIYDGKEDKNTYNLEIVEYLNSRNDISYEEMVDILESLDMTVLSDGTVQW